jgi:hypothetical protein
MPVLWETPFYRFRIMEEDESNFKEVIFDVTGSAPPMIDVKDTMQSVFKKLLNDHGKEIDTILDFGAAKLRITLYFLNLEKKVCAVEFKEIHEKSNDAKKILESCLSNSRFQNLVFPQPFIGHNYQYDLVLLINVLPIMPVFAERLLVLQLLHSKLKEKGLLLWYAQKEGDYKNKRESGKYTLGDGIWVGTKKKYKTFYKYHAVEDVDEMMALCGFQLLDIYSAPGNDARLYQKSDYNLFKGIVTPDLITKNIPVDLSIIDPPVGKLKSVQRIEGLKEVVPNPISLSIENLYRNTLSEIAPGHDGAEIYHRVTSRILFRVFRGSLDNMEIKQRMNKGKKIIDTVYSNIAETGFFSNLSKKFDIKCPYIVVEAKNYTYDPENPEFDQLGGRLNDKIGKFGILVCRSINDIQNAKERCEGFLDDSKYLIFLTDNDLFRLLEFFQDGDNTGINNLMDSKLRPLVFRE